MSGLLGASMSNLNRREVKKSLLFGIDPTEDLSNGVLMGLVESRTRSITVGASRQELLNNMSEMLRILLCQ